MLKTLYHWATFVALPHLKKLGGGHLVAYMPEPAGRN